MGVFGVGMFLIFFFFFFFTCFCLFLNGLKYSKQNVNFCASCSYKS